jgi:DNA-binding NarL/FixJ family response regulator
MVEERQTDLNREESFQRIKVMVADNQPSFRKKLSKLIDLQPDISVVGEARSGREAYHLISKHQPDVLLMVVRMPLLEGIEISRAISDRYKTIQIIFLFTKDEEEFFPEGLRFGAIGYPLSDTATHQIVRAIRSTIQGEYLGKSTQWVGIGEEFEKFPDQEQRLAAANVHLNKPLNIYEFEILKLLYEGMSNHEIATAQNLSVGTVRNYVTSIYKKLEVRNRTEAVFKVRQIGIF